MPFHDELWITETTTNHTSGCAKFLIELETRPCPDLDGWVEAGCPYPIIYNFLGRSYPQGLSLNRTNVRATPNKHIQMHTQKIRAISKARHSAC